MDFRKDRCFFLTNGFRAGQASDVDHISGEWLLINTFKALTFFSHVLVAALNVFYSDYAGFVYLTEHLLDLLENSFTCEE